MYVDDILVHSKTFEDHIEHLRKLFTRLRDKDIKLKPSKCLIARKELIFLGHMISEEGIRPDPKRSKRLKTGKHQESSKKATYIPGTNRIL